MRIYLYTKFFPLDNTPIQDGIVKAVDGLAAGFAANGTPVTVLSEDRQGGSRQAAAGYVHHCFPTDHPEQSPRLSPQLKQFIQTHITDRDLVILNGGFHLSIYALGRFLFRQGIPYVVAPHITYDRAMFRKSPYLKYPYWYLLERRLLKRAAAIQVLDQRQGTHLKQRRIATPIVAVPNGFNPQDLQPLPTTPNPPHQTINLFFFGRLSRSIKGLDLLLEAVAQLAHHPDRLRPTEGHRPRLKLTLQGHDPGDRESLQQLSHQLGISDRVEFLAPDYQTPAAQLMQDYDIVCLPSRSEGFGLSALEAMLAGRVVLISAVAGIAPHVEASHGGIVVEPNAASIAAGLQQLLNCQNQWVTMGAAGRQYALQQFPWPTIAQTAEREYSELFRS